MTRRGPVPRSDFRGDEGLGLVEVLVSVVILSIGVLAIAGASLQVNGRLDESRLDTERTLVARQVMERLRMGPWASIGSGTDTLAVGSRSYVVVRTVTSPLRRVKLVELSVSSDDRALAGAPRVFTGRILADRSLPVAP